MLFRSYYNNNIRWNNIGLSVQVFPQAINVVLPGLQITLNGDGSILYAQDTDATDTYIINRVPTTALVTGPVVIPGSGSRDLSEWPCTVSLEYDTILK